MQTNANILRRDLLTDDLAIMQLQHDQPEPVIFTPGQFVTIALPDPRPPRTERQKKMTRLVRRAYSLANVPGDNYMELFVAKVDDGLLTPQLFDLAQGDRLWVDPIITGQFTLEQTSADKNMLMIATGTGVAPFVAIARTYANNNRWRRCLIVHGARTAGHLGYQDTLEQLAEQDHSFSYLPIVSREPDNSAFTGHRGRVQHLIDKLPHVIPDFLINPCETEIFLCGGSQMIEQVMTHFQQQGFTAESQTQHNNLHFERYW